MTTTLYSCVQFLTILLFPLKVRCVAVCSGFITRIYCMFLHSHSAAHSTTQTQFLFIFIFLFNLWWLERRFFFLNIFFSIYYTSQNMNISFQFFLLLYFVVDAHKHTRIIKLKWWQKIILPIQDTKAFGKPFLLPSSAHSIRWKCVLLYFVNLSFLNVSLNICFGCWTHYRKQF